VDCVDASLTLGWYLKDDRAYSLDVLAGLKSNDAIVPFLWTYEVASGLVMAHRRKRVTQEEVAEIISSLRALPIVVDPPSLDVVLQLPALALKHQLTVYDAPIWNWPTPEAAGRHERRRIETGDDFVRASSPCDRDCDWTTRPRITSRSWRGD
jgi:predicted nucleic acid-binding protein